MDLKNITRSWHYQLAQVDHRVSVQADEAASRWRVTTDIYQRGAELGSQAFEHVARGKLFERLGEVTDREREIALAFVRYALYGRTDEV